ncbi:hypothetical protein EV426DRAFT_627641 [Tirmania nivea]|nr:hypothetical protein EV426DRAFT_627641 [Tirmania nivea]
MARNNANTPAPDAGSQLFAEAVASISQEGRISFETSAILCRRLGGICRRAENEMSTIRVLVTEVTEEALDRALSKFRFRRNLRVWLEDGSGRGAAILTFSPSVTHEVASRRFFVEILARVVRIPGHDLDSIEGVGAARFHCPGRRSKEGDEGIRCSARAGGNEWPNVMIGVGFSEPLAQLRFDARWWLLNSGGRTNLVILVLVKKEPKSLVIEAWERVPNPNPRTRHAPATVPSATTILTIDEVGVVTPANGSLVIPYNALFDNPHPNATPLIFTTAELTHIAGHILSHV